MTLESGLQFVFSAVTQYLGLFESCDRVPIPPTVYESDFRGGCLNEKKKKKKYGARNAPDHVIMHVYVFV